MRFGNFLMAAAITPVVLTASPTTMNAAAVSNESAQHAELTVEGVVSKALQNNLDLEIMRVDLDKEEANWMSARADAGKIKFETVTSLDQANKKYETVAKAEKDKELKRFSVREQENKLKLEARAAFYEALYLQKDVELKQSQAGKKQTEEGLKALAEARGNLQKALQKLHEVMGEGEGEIRGWRLIEDRTGKPYELPPLEDVIEKGYRQRTEILKKQAELKWAEVKVNLVYQYSSLLTYKGQVARSEARKAELDLLKLKAAAKKDMTLKYNTLKAAIENRTQRNEGLKRAEESYQAAMEQDKEGIVTPLEREQAEEAWFKAKADELAADREYKLALAAFEYSVGE
ncbi:TolC family protein [Brevibacillus massiliensis]|uniref:TolC family protein n=1 Tax=Brevibacillus massiliensis TaxID=1118054 RepID=UPI00031A2140|nr:TolC family protein [Brevibacillus massiliensis]